MASGTDEAVVTVSTSDLFPIVNRFDLRVERADGEQEFISTLDFSTREGFDASSADSLDQPDVSKPYINPMPFDEQSKVWMVEYRVPISFAAKVEGDRWVVIVTDVFDNRYEVEVASIDLQWV